MRSRSAFASPCRRIRSLPLLAAACAGLIACSEEPDEPGDCTPEIARVEGEWKALNPLRRDLDLDSLRAAIAQTRDVPARDHLVQEYVLVANELPPDARSRALASLEQELERPK